MNTYVKCVRNPRTMNTYKFIRLKVAQFQHLQKTQGEGFRNSVAPKNRALSEGKLAEFHGCANFLRL